MKLTVYPSDKGDCLLLRAESGLHILIDGGMQSSYTAHVAASLNRLRRQGKPLDLVYVSHIDQDHISGVLRLLDDEAAWRVHEHQLANGNPSHSRPESPRPPQVGGIWHNAFHELAGDNAGAIQDMLAATAAVLFGAPGGALREAAVERQDLALSIPEAIRVSRRIGGSQLNIPLNAEFGGKLAMVRDGQAPVQLGSLSLSVIGPFEADLKKLRSDWNKWLEVNQDALAALQHMALIDEENLAAGAATSIADAAIAQANELGRRSSVTVPNLASLMLFVEEAGKTLLLTGDGHSSDVLKGLAHHGKLDAQGRLHVDVLKVPHHGSEHNLDQAFCDAVTADDYVFCANGAHDNPDLRVVRLIVERRLAAGGNARFKLWFNCHSSRPGKAADVAHMAKVEGLVTELAAASGGRLKSKFLTTGTRLDVTV